jgi:hypothetical protein
MKAHSLTILHYGKDYLSYALRSIYHSVEQCHIFYTPTPSHGHSVNVPPIEIKEELQQAAYTYDPDNKVIWYDMINMENEGMHRDIALRTIEAAGAELVLVVDYDEIWPTSLASEFISYAEQTNHYRNYLINMIHIWRSFNWCCYDDGWPVRIIDLRHDYTRQDVGYLPKEIGRVFHFGYATTNKVMQYKWQIHGHKNELRPNWFRERWYRWPPQPDCHPTNDKGFWNPVMFDKLKLPVFMAEHPFFGMDKIE